MRRNTGSWGLVGEVRYKAVNGWIGDGSLRVESTGQVGSPGCLQYPISSITRRMTQLETVVTYVWVGVDAYMPARSRGTGFAWRRATKIGRRMKHSK